MEAGSPIEAAGRALVTGATGFVGSHLVRALSAWGPGVRALVRRTSASSHLAALGIERVEGALGDRAALARAVEGVDVVFHLAAATRARTAAEYGRANAEGTRALVEAVLTANPRPRRIVYLSSLAATGPSVSGRPVERDDRPRPLTAYGRSKLEGERICLTAADVVKVTILRASAVYGPRDRDLLRYFRLAMRGVLPIPTGPERPVQLIHASDLAEMLVRAGTAGNARGIYHVAEPRAYAWATVARLIASAVGRRARVVRVPTSVIRSAAALSEWGAGAAGRATIFNRDKARELLAPGWLCETDAAIRQLGFTPRIPLEQGLAETAAWYRDRGWLS